MMVCYDDVPRMPRELVLAKKEFRKKLSKNKRLGFLLLIDPIRAFKDAGIELGKEARKYIRKRNPQLACCNRDLYDAVKAGRIRLPWITSVKLPGKAEIDKPGR